MFHDTAEATLHCSSISLEDGADEAWMNGEPIECRKAGMAFPSRWQFNVGAMLSLTLEICGTGERTRVECTVVGCEPLHAGQEARLWTVTVLFLDTPVPVGKFKLGVAEPRFMGRER